MALEYRLRDFEPKDGAALLDVHTRSVLAISRRYYRRSECEGWVSGLHAGWYAERVAMGEQLFVADCTDKGLIAFSGHRSFGPNGEITMLFTAPEMQGQGIASALLAAMLDGLSARRVREVHVKSSLSAVTFYEQHGFDVRERIMRETLGGVQIPIRVMERVL